LLIKRKKNKTKRNPRCTTCTEMLNYEHQANILAILLYLWESKRHLFVLLWEAILQMSN